MALGNNNEGIKAINLKLVAKQGDPDTPLTKEDAPKFVKKDEDFNLTNETYTQVKGKINKIKTSHNGKSWQKEVKGFVIEMEDDGEKYYIDSTMSNASKDLANHALANIGKEVVITLYLNKSNYPASVVKTLNGEHTPSHFDFKGLDKNALWDAIKAQEEQEVGTNKEEGFSVEDIPF